MLCLGLGVLVGCHCFVGDVTCTTNNVALARLVFSTCAVHIHCSQTHDNDH